MELHYELTNLEFEQQFANCELNPSMFSHEAHIRLAWIHISKYGPVQAEANITRQLQKFVAHVGAKDKYNHTLTVAAIKAVSHFIQQSKAQNFENFIADFPQLVNNFKGLIRTHYSFDIFNSLEAKTKFIVPDKLPFS